MQSNTVIDGTHIAARDINIKIMVDDYIGGWRNEIEEENFRTLFHVVCTSLSQLNALSNVESCQAQKLFASPVKKAKIVAFGLPVLYGNLKLAQ